MNDRTMTNGVAKGNPISPKVSVIIRCYNYGRYLDEAVQSVLNQTYHDFEIIVVDDGSTDPETIRFLDTYHPIKTRLVRTSNQGLSSALNNGIRVCAGKYILPLDADDKIGSTYLEKAVRVLDENEAVGIVYCKAELFGEESGEWELLPYRFPEILLGNMIFSSALFRKSDWAAVSGFNVNMVYGCEDYDFWLSLIELGRQVFCIPDTLFFYRKHSDSTMTKMSRERAIDSLAQLFRNHPQTYTDNMGMLLTVASSAQSKDQHISKLEKLFHDQITKKDEQIADLGAQVGNLETIIRDLQLSFSWRITKPLRRTKAAFQKHWSKEP